MTIAFLKIGQNSDFQGQICRSRVIWNLSEKYFHFKILVCLGIKLKWEWNWAKNSYCEELVKVRALTFVTAKVVSTVTDARGFLAQITTAMIYLHNQSQLLYQPFLTAFKGQIHYQHRRYKTLVLFVQKKKMKLWNQNNCVKLKPNQFIHLATFYSNHLSYYWSAGPHVQFLVRR